MIGGGRAGREAARSAAAAGRQVVLVDERGFAAENDDFEVLAPARAIGIYEGGLVPVDAGSVLYRFRAERIVVATGALEQPLVFPGNDLVGVYLPEAVRRLVDEWSLKPGERAMIVSADDRGLAVVDQLQRAGTNVLESIDLRSAPPRQLTAHGHRGRLSGVVFDGRELACDMLVMSGGRQPAYSLLAQAGARIEFDADRGIFVPSDLPPNVEAVGSVAGDVKPAAVPAASYNGADAAGRCFVCVCEDVTEKDMKRAIAEGFDSIELAKRYTTVTMGPCQGRLCHVPSIRLFAREHETDEATIGTTTARPPWAPVSLGPARGPRPRAHQADVDPPPARGGRRDDDVDRPLAPCTLLRARRKRGAERPPDGRRHRCVHPRQAPRAGGGRRAVPRAPVSQPLRRHEDRAHPLRRARDRRWPDHGRRHDRASRRGPVLRHDHLDRRRHA